MNTRDAFKFHTKGESTHAFTPRLPELQSLNGTIIEVPPQLDIIKLQNSIGLGPMSYLQWLFKSNNLNIADCIISGKVGEKNLGKWLKHSHIPEDIISKVCAAKTDISKLTLSTRYKDFARIAASEHYSSCLNSGNQKTISYYLHKPNIFLLLDRDNSGQFKTRVIGRITRVTKSSDEQSIGLPRKSVIIIFNRTYGVKVGLPEYINGIPCFTQPQKFEDSNCERDISRELVRYEMGLEQLGKDPNSLDSVYDDLFNTRKVIVPPNIKKLSQPTLRGLEMANDYNSVEITMQVYG